MSLSPRCFALAQIASLVGSIGKKNYKANCTEIAKLVEIYGFEADKHLFRCLVSSVDFISEGRNSDKDGQQLQLLIQEANSLVTKPNFVTILCYAFEKQDSKGLPPTSQLLSQVARVLKLARVQEVVFALGLTNSTDPDLKDYAAQHLKNKLPELIRSYSDLSSGLEGGFGELAIEVLHVLLSHLILIPEEEVGVSAESTQTFIETLRRDFPRERVPVVLAPLLYREQQDITEDRLVPVSVTLPPSVFSIHLSDIIKEIGYVATSSKQDMMEILKDYGKGQINSTEVAKVLGMMASTTTGLPEGAPFMGLSGDLSHPQGKVPTSWDVRIFTSSVHSLLPSMNWREVILHLDYPEFYLDSPEGLSLIITAYKSVSRDPFPLETIYLGWSCTQGQLSLFRQAIKGCAEFSIAQFPLCSMQLHDDLKVNINSDEAKTWRSLSLIESLLHLAEQGHYEEVLDMMKQPMKHCPEILFLGVIRTQHDWRLLQQEVVSKLLPHFVSNHSAFSSVLREAWQTSTVSPHIQHILVSAISEWYYSTDPADPSKVLAVLEMAKELRVLPSILTANKFPFILELACWAAKRDFLMLDKWISDKMREYKMFLVDCLHFLVVRAPQPLGQNQERSCLTSEIILSFLSCLNTFRSSLKPDMNEKLNSLIAVHGPLPTKTGRPPLGPGGASSSLDLSGLGFAGPGMGVGSPGSPGKNSSAFGSTGFPGLQAGSHFSGQSLFGNTSNPSFPYLSGIGAGTLGPGVHGKTPPQSLHLQQQPSQMTGKQSVIGGGEPGSLFGSEQNFSKEVDDQANSYFQAIYNRGMSVDRLLEELKKFKDSPNKKERDLFMCMLRNMFEEYKFFPKFPEKELQITGQLFGGIIEHGLVTYVSLCFALRYVLQSLKNPPSSKIYLFGLAALDKFKRRLHEFSQYCGSIASIPHFQAFPDHLKQYIHYGQQSMEPPSSGSAAPSSTSITPFSSLAMSPSVPGSHSSTDMGSNTPLTVPSFPIQPLTSINTSIHSNFPTGSSPSPVAGNPLSPHGPFEGGSPSSKPPGGGAGSPIAARREAPSITSTNIDTLLVAADQQTEHPPPPDELQDKMHFLFNNLSSSNFHEKTEEARGLILEEHFDWVAQYLVMKRASIEPNFHTLYMNFLDQFGSVKLRKRVLKETYRNIKVILQADKTGNNFSDRTILKNLGHWLGMITLAKNKPILQLDLALKDLILEAHFKGPQELLYVIPFVAKILESCADSSVFKPPNPWTMAIMSVLRELHAVQDLKLNLRFEVEVLCKHLSLEIGEITASKLLSNTDKAKSLNQLSAPKDPSPVDPQPSGGTLAQQSVGAPSTQSQFHVDDINTSSLAGLYTHLQLNPQISLLQQYPQLKQCVKPSVEKSVQDLLNLVVERSIKVALTTTEHIIKKDFSLDPDIHRMHMAAQHMVRNLTAGMALITCREPLLLSISSNLKTAFTNSLRTPSEELKGLIDQASQQISAENTELACAFIQKTAMEKAMPEMEKRLTEEFDLRKMARNEGRRYCNTAALTYQAERMPEQIRLNVGGPSQQQAAVYEEYARSMPGFLPNTHKDGSYTGKTEFIPNEEFVQILMKCIQEINQNLRAALAPPNNPHILMMRSLLEMTMQLRITQNHINVLTLLQKALEGLLEGMNPPPSDPEFFVSFRDCHLLILKMIQGHSGLGSAMAMHHVTRILLGAREDIKYSPRAIILLIGLQIVDMKILDEYLAKAIENGRNLIALSCSIKLVNAIMSAEKRETPITDKDLLKTKDTLYRLAANVKLLPDSSAQLMEPFRISHDIQLISGGTNILSGSGSVGDLDRAPGAPTTGMIQTNLVMGPTTEMEDPPGLYEKVEYLLSEWVRHFHQPSLLREGDKIYAAYVARLQQQGILKSDDLITRFFRISVEMCVDLCYRTLNDQSINASMARAKCYHTMDAFVKLVVVLVRYSGDVSNTGTKVNLLNKVLVTVSHVLIQDHEHKHGDFHQLAYHRFFIMLINDLSASDPVFDAINFPVLHAFSHVFHIIRPSRAPGFAYSWLELISHRTFIAKLLLQTPQQKGWPLFHQLLIDLFKFLSPFLRNAELTKPTQLLYKGTLRVLLVLLHDFPEFLCDYHFSFCDVIPPNCIQMRNLILSAFPRNMRLPDPFTPNLRVETLPDIAHAPRILPPYTQHISPNLKKDLDNYIRTRAPVKFLQELRGHLTVSSDPGNQYYVSLMNALVLYVGTQAIAYIHSKERTPSTTTIAHTAHMDIFQHLVVDLDTEGRYLFLNAIANQLRYPNSHTHYFSCALLSLFAETNAEAIQEQITRVLLERLIVNRPHPWGLLITFIELIKNSSYNFWKHEFVHCAPEIEKLFGSVAKSCMQKQPTREEVVVS